MEQEDEPPLTARPKNLKNTSIKPKQYERAFEYIAILWRWFFGDVFGHPKDLLDFQRPIVRCGPLSVF